MGRIGSLTGREDPVVTDTFAVSAVVIRNSEGHVLTVRKQGTTRFMFPGGKPAAGETARTTAVREVAEELGVRIDPAMLRWVGEFTTSAANEPGRRIVASVFEHPAVPVDAPRSEIAELSWRSPDSTDSDLAPLLTEAVFPVLRAQRIRRVTVFTGSALGDTVDFTTGAAELATSLVHNGIGMVYGGGHVGLMGIIGDAAMAAGGEVIGVMPQSLVDGESAHRSLTELEIVPDMHTRKLRMAALGDAFVALPGGVGTLEELFEVWTWQQLGLHRKPVALYDIDDYWQPLLTALDVMTERGFLTADRRNALIVARHPDELHAALENWQPLTPSAWRGPAPGRAPATHGSRTPRAGDVRRSGHSRRREPPR